MCLKLCQLPLPNQSQRSEKGHVKDPLNRVSEARAGNGYGCLARTSGRRPDRTLALASALAAPGQRN